jgi:hypothetical protein
VKEGDAIVGRAAIIGSPFFEAEEQRRFDVALG